MVNSHKAIRKSLFSSDFSFESIGHTHSVSSYISQNMSVLDYLDFLILYVYIKLFYNLWKSVYSVDYTVPRNEYNLNTVFDFSVYR